MTLERQNFVRYHEEKKQDIVSLKLNKEERAELEELKKILRQPKDSTAIKQLRDIGAKVILTSETRELLEIVFNNTRRNKRLGITEF